MYRQQNRSSACIKKLFRSPSLHNEVPWDERRVLQVLLNLTPNAAKFTAAGGDVCARTYQSADCGVVMETSDTGIGIPASNLEQVMEPFVRLENQVAGVIRAQA